MRRIALFATFTCIAQAATTIAETKLVVSSGSPAMGFITVRPSVPFASPDGSRVDGGDVRFDVVAGRLTLRLLPNDSSNPPNTRYLVTWHLDGMTPRTEVWNVPTTSLTLRVNDVFSQLISPTAMVALSQLQQGGATTNQALCWNGTSWQPGSCGGGGGGWTVNDVPCSSSPTFNLALGNVQRITLTCSVTSASITNITANTVAVFEVCQDSIGNRPFAWPAAVHGGVVVGTQASKCTAQWFYSTNGSVLRSQGLGTINQ